MASMYCVFIYVDDSHKDILQAMYKVLNSWTVMEENPKENTAGSGREIEHYKKNSDNGNNEPSDDDGDEIMVTAASIVMMAMKQNQLKIHFYFSVHLSTKQFKNYHWNAGKMSTLKMEYKNLQGSAKENYTTKNMDYITSGKAYLIWKLLECLIILTLSG